MRDRLDALVGDELGDGQRIDLERVDCGERRRLGVAPGDLREREFGYVAALGHEFEVEREGARRADGVRDLAQPGPGGDEGRFGGHGGCGPRVVEARGLEPLTSALRTPRSPN